MSKKNKNKVGTVVKAVTQAWMGGQYQGYSTCDHWREEVKVGGFTVLASGYRGAPKGDSLLEPPVPDVGIYLYGSWGTKFSAFTGCGMNTPTKWHWPFLVVDWPDMGVMEENEQEPLIKAVEKEVRKGKVVEIACMGGHGRTGTLLAMMKVKIGGMGAKAAIEELREEYCDHTVESQKQVDAIYKLAGEPKPEKDEVKPYKGFQSSHTYASPLWCKTCNHSEYMHRKTVVGDKDKGCNAKKWSAGTSQGDCDCEEFADDGTGSKPSSQGAVITKGVSKSTTAAAPASTTYNKKPRTAGDMERDRCVCKHPRSAHLSDRRYTRGEAESSDDFWCVMCKCDDFDLDVIVRTVEPEQKMLVQAGVQSPWTPRGGDSSTP